ncbi:hypothetical protein CAPTEDRAFT_203023 [Capitella teleta]|uniref:F5/8 type C domain-containing protein n=1 Tax=Capitella teleta TaxID=283909 RepID=R7TMN2_CAPTE|nr:hypothetical protein CAPTEDRAFT_203023 [Capitella teleta]|eukprot:ELT95133.1 hypothetical protein CAPTEDRAFT_203023 [Capitella teleta]
MGFPMLFMLVYLILTHEMIGVNVQFSELLWTLFTLGKQSKAKTNQIICAPSCNLIMSYTYIVSQSLHAFHFHIWFVPIAASCQYTAYEPLIANSQHSQLTASSAQKGHGASESKSTGLGWCPTRVSVNPWIQIDFVTWGRINGAYNNQFVKSYRINYCADDSNVWTDYADAEGNTTFNLVGPKISAHQLLTTNPVLASMQGIIAFDCNIRD